MAPPEQSMYHCITPFNCSIGVIGLSLEQLQECKRVLLDFEMLLKKHAPSNAKNYAQCLKALLWAAKKGKKGDIISRLERHKNTLELALLAVSM